MPEETKKKAPSALDAERAQESQDAFGQNAQSQFGENERGAEDIIDMYEKGSL
ncbi:MAG: hypothetical protein IJ772_05075 [Bacilli bacterium]|nr:hypothetical protein [Bacilli bacterium]